MSIKLMTMVWDRAEIAGPRLLALLAMADAANDDGVFWHSIPQLARKARLSPRRFREIASDLESWGYLQREYRAGHSNIWVLDIHTLAGIRSTAETRSTYDTTPAETRSTPLRKLAAPPAETRSPPCENSQGEPSSNRKLTVIEPSVYPQEIDKHPRTRARTREEVRDPTTGHVQPPGTKSRRFRDLLPRIPEPPQKETAQ